MTSAAAAMARAFLRLEARATRAANWWLDLVFPPTCGNCGLVDSRFCPDCLRQLEQFAFEASARRVEGLDAACATGRHRGLLQKAMLAFKYDGATALSEPLAARLNDALRRLEWEVDAVIPVPLFADREAERGYNQSALLSRHVVSALGIESRAESLKRLRSTSQQALLSGAERQANVAGAFEASDEIKGLSILLIDDVVTTGATLRECAAALRKKGANKVYAIAVSHA